MKHLSVWAVFALLLAWLGSPVSAHHSFAAEFDANTQAELTGTITGVSFSNPHARYILETKTADGATEKWDVQAASLATLLGVGWNAQTLKVGDRITVAGQLGRNGAKKLYLRTAVRPDGTKLATGRDGSGPDPNVVHADPKKSYGYGALRTSYPVDITGGWRNGYKHRATVDDLEPKPTPFTPEGKRVFEATKSWEDPSLRCLAPGLPKVFGAPYNMEIVDAGTHYLMYFLDHNNLRHVWMDGRTPSAATNPTSLGFSVGHWEGEALVIETTHLLAGWLDGSGLPMSGDGTRIVERWAVSADRLSIERTMTIHDSYYTAPLVRTRASARDDNLDVSETATCDPAGYYRDLRDQGRLDEQLDR